MVESLHTVPRIVRADRGSENTIIGALQSFFRASDLSSCFQYGSSTRNQWLESWWSQLRRLWLNWWINYFKDMKDISIFDSSLKYHKKCLRFCFMEIIQKELNETRRLWNNHRIRYNRNSECPTDRSDVLRFPQNYSVVEIVGMRSLLFTLILPKNNVRHHFL